MSSNTFNNNFHSSGKYSMITESLILTDNKSLNPEQLKNKINNNNNKK